MTNVQNLKRGDTLPILNVTLTAPGGGAFDPTGYDVTLHLRGNGVTLSRPMTIADAPTGRVTYAWVAADWDDGGLEVGAYDMEYECVHGVTAARLTFPNDNIFDQLHVAADLA